MPCASPLFAKAVAPNPLTTSRPSVCRDADRHAPRSQSLAERSAAGQAVYLMHFHEETAVLARRPWNRSLSFAAFTNGTLASRSVMRSQGTCEKKNCLCGTLGASPIEDRRVVQDMHNAPPYFTPTTRNRPNPNEVPFPICTRSPSSTAGHIAARFPSTTTLPISPGSSIR